MKISMNARPKMINSKAIYTAFFVGIIGLTAHSVVANSKYNSALNKKQIVDKIETGNLTVIQQLVAEGLDLNKDLGNDGTPLILAVRSGNLHAVQYLIKQGADINLQSETDGNPLVVASLNNNVELVKYLHEHGATIDAITQYDETALISASRAGHFEVVKYLVENGADVNLSVEAQVASGKELRSPLNGAKTNQIRTYLISKGAHS